ncbi:transcription elongation factor GreA [Candidatus Parcubacteria bacterium]|jgi:transcription elongation factor GreA|nr:transcription elongation factor GreA [Candidatus Parcubacteria bacterium]
MSKYFTPDGLEKLKKEILELKTDKRREIAQRLKKAISYGDLSENADYAEAKEQQAFLEGRILELDNLIKTAKVVLKNSQNGWVQIGSVVLVKTDGTTEKFEIVGAEEASPLEGKISIESPIGRAFLDKPEGAIITVSAPQGDIRYKILKIS